MAAATDESMANGADESAGSGGMNGSPAVAPVKRGRGRPPKAGGPAVKKPPAPTPAGAKKRGRPPKAKRGRPKSVPQVATMRASIQHAPPTSPRRVLSPSANAAGNSNNDADVDEPVVKRGRGRPKKREGVAKAPKAAYIPTGKPRGRPPKGRSASASISPPKKTSGSGTTRVKKRGRPPKSSLANGSPKKATPAPTAGIRKRGRPPKAAKNSTIASMDQVADAELGATTSSGATSGAPAKKRGRQRKAAPTPVATVNEANDDVEEQESDEHESLD